MSKYLVETETHRDENDRITRTGASWGETQPGLEQLLMMFGGLGFMAALAGGAWMLLARSPNMLFLGGVVVFGGAIWTLVKMPGRPRALYFHPDGVMETPHGIYYLPGIGAIGGDHAHIVSIEARAQHDQPRIEGGEWERMYEVIIISRSGDLVCVSRNLKERVALKAAAQLSQSLAAIRRESADGLSVTLE